MMNHATRTWTTPVTTTNWKPSQRAIRGAQISLATGLTMMLVSFPAIAAAASNPGANPGEGSLQGLEFLAFIAVVALAPGIILLGTSLIRMGLDHFGLVQEGIPEIIYPMNPLVRVHDDSAPRSIEIPNSQFGLGKVEIPRIQFQEEAKEA